MISTEVEKVLILLEKIEKAMSGIYGSLAVYHSFSDEVRAFWATMMEAELKHAALFRNIRSKAKNNESIQVELNFNVDHLIKSYSIAQKVQRIVVAKEISEKKAYTVGADLEEKLFEFNYFKRVTSNSAEVMEAIKKVDDDTKHHHFTLHNYALEGFQ